MSEPLTGLALLRAPFPPNQINKLPKPYKADSPKGHCSVCGGYHGLPAAHLDYIGHAALTARLLDADPAWTWQPMAVDAAGAPVLDKNGGLWIRLTVCGVTRPGYGDAQGKQGGNAVKEAIGDALRNAAMRFGAGLELWHKGELYVPETKDGAEAGDAMLAAFRAAAMEGKAKLKATYDRIAPNDAFWDAHKASLLAAAKRADLDKSTTKEHA